MKCRKCKNTIFTALVILIAYQRMKNITMKKNYLKMVAVFFVFLFISNIFSEENESPLLQNNLNHDVSRKERTKEESDYSAKLGPQGDYSSITFSIQSNKKTYVRGEPIFIFTYAKSSSPEYVYIGRSDSDIVNIFVANQIKILNENMEEIPLTQYGKACCQKRSIYGNNSGFNGAIGINNTYDRLLLQPYRFVINNYFDMTKPGKYQITFYRERFFNDQYYENPLVSNTLTIEVIDKSFTPEELVVPGYVSDPEAW